MCGIFGLITKPNSTHKQNAVRKILENIAVFSESRGKDSSDMAILKLGAGSIDVIKGDVPPRSLLRSGEFQSALPTTGARLPTWPGETLRVFAANWAWKTSLFQLIYTLETRKHT